MKLNLYPKPNPTLFEFTDKKLPTLEHNYIKVPSITRDASDRIELSYDIHNRITKIENKNHTIEFEYDIMSRVDTQLQDNIKINWSEDVSLHEETKTFLGHTLKIRQYTRDRKKTLILDKQKTITLSYNIEEKTQTIHYPNGLKEHYTFDIARHPLKLETANQTFNYRVDSMGRIIKLNDTLYKYDAIGRLCKAGSKKFKYDKAGNNKLNQAVYNMKNYQLLENHNYIYTYDRRGNLKYKIHKKTKEEKHYGFNIFNQLEEYLVIDSQGNQLNKIRYTYDGLNRRISKTKQGVLHYYVYDKENIIAILDQDKNELATIVHHPTKVDTPLSITNQQTGKTYYYHRDHQGSIIALSNAEGKLVELIEYDGHYGTIQNHTTLEDTFNPYGYTGRETDDSDLYYYRARYYDPTIGRFLSQDPIGFESGDFNFYRYVKNDPVNFIDPSGLSSCECKIVDSATNSTYPSKDNLKVVDPKVLRDNHIQKILDRSQRGVDAGRGIPLMTREQATARVDSIDAMNGKVWDAVGLGLSTASLFNPVGLGTRLGIAALCIDIAQVDEIGIGTGVAATFTNHPITKTADIGYGIWAVIK